MSGEGRASRGRGNRGRGLRQDPTQPQGQSAPQGAWGGGSRGGGAPIPQQQQQAAQPQPTGAWSRQKSAPQTQAAPPSAWGAPKSAPTQPQQPVKARGGPQAQAPQHGVAALESAMSKTSLGRGGPPDRQAAAATVASGRGGVRGGGRMVNPETMVTRPADLDSKKGESGTKVLLTANYFKLLKHTDWCLFQYRVDMAPEEDRTMIKKALLRHHQAKLGSYIFDGTVLYTARRLPENLSLVSQRKGLQGEPDVNVNITVRFVSQMVKGDHHYLQFFNIIMRKCLEFLKLTLVGRNFYDAAVPVSISEYKLQLWHGYETSIRQHEQDILMCAEITHKVMREETVWDIFRSLHQGQSRDLQRDFRSKVIGMIVLTDYNNNTYKIDDVDFNATPKSTFEKKGEKVTYIDYYRQKYNIQLRNPSQPMLVSRPKARERRAGQSEIVYLIPELCRATGLTDDMRNNFQLMKALGEHTRVKPIIRIQKLLQFNNRLYNEPQIVQEFKNWDLELEKNLVQINGRQLPYQDVYFRQNFKWTKNPHDWTGAFRNCEMFTHSPLNQWAVITPSFMTREVNDFLKSLNDSCRGMKFVINRPEIFPINDDRAGSYTKAIEDVMSSMNPQLIFCAVPNNRLDRYSAIKKKCAVDRPVPSQVCVKRNLSKGLSVATKIAVQLNCKLGGAAWAINLPMSKLMVIGFDVCHDTNVKGRDYGAMVASLDRNCTRYYSAVSPHHNGEELSNDLAMNIIKALHKYKEIHGEAPSHILIYRDGVGEGQVPYVVEHEIENIRNKLNSFYAALNAEPKMAFILVTKRLNTRFFHGKENPMPGTVVDDVVTNPAKFDFFIVSQLVNQGTVSPTGYSVLYSNIGLSPDKLQLLSYRLTHAYYNWPGPVRVPAPCQYAHKLAFLVSQAIHNAPEEQLNTLLHYL